MECAPPGALFVLGLISAATFGDPFLPAAFAAPLLSRRLNQRAFSVWSCLSGLRGCDRNAAPLLFQVLDLGFFSSQLRRSMAFFLILLGAPPLSFPKDMDIVYGFRISLLPHMVFLATSSPPLAPRAPPFVQGVNGALFSVALPSSASGSSGSNDNPWLQFVSPECVGGAFPNSPLDCFFFLGMQFSGLSSFGFALYSL